MEIVKVRLYPVITGWRKTFLGVIACKIGFHKGTIYDGKTGWVKCDKCDKEYLKLPIIDNKD